MLPIGPLMIEHRLIERMIRIIKELLEIIQAEKKEDPAQVERIIHFVRAYADRCHHGKEEEILFRELGRKAISPEHKRMIDELIEDHMLGRRITTSLAEANRRYLKGDTAALSDIAAGLRSLIEFYPQHIEKEDRHFFIPVMGYFSPEEKEAMIREGYESDSRLLHEEYADLVKTLEAEK
jgi:hemerythrin-like domain-containing protein